VGTVPDVAWRVDSIPVRCDSRHDRCVQAALLSWVLIGGVVGLVADRIAREAFPGGALGALFGGGAGGFLGGAIFAVVTGADGGRLDPVGLAAAAAGAGALVAAIGAAGRGSVSRR
jgi:uncharacterized membrane protein YeaQ/YmgE (transglycosylase-associated protein family)